jgi:3-deoxy-manno-octulosonate cytidylyltransferase (CMP-KDO synthetase)
MASSRFPGKPLTPIAGRPMLEHCYRGTRESTSLDDVVIATCDEEIANWAAAQEIPYVMTSDQHERATDRVAEATESVDADAIVLVQGDEPLVTADMVDAALAPVLNEGAGCTNLVKRIDTEDEFTSENTVKVVADLEGHAMYFSRSPIPSPRLLSFGALQTYKQVAVFGFTRARLLEFSSLEPSPLELAESVDMLRYLEHGRPIHVVETHRNTHGVDIPGDVAVVEEFMATRPKPA